MLKWNSFQPGETTFPSACRVNFLSPGATGGGGTLGAAAGAAARGAEGTSGMAPALMEA